MRIKKYYRSIYTPILVFLIFISIIFFWKSEKSASVVYVEDDFDSLDDNRYILIWTEQGFGKKWGIDKNVMDNKFFEECPETRCVITNNRSFLPEHRFNAIFFNAAELTERSRIPKTRSPHQIYVFGMPNMPPKNPKNKFDHIIFNWTSKCSDF